MTSRLHFSRRSATVRSFRPPNQATTDRNTMKEAVEHGANGLWNE